MSKELIVSVNGREKKIAIVEDDVVTEFYVERGDENQGIVGNIYKGRVMKVLPGMQSAFVDIGLERDSFLYVSDFFDEEDLDDEGEERKEAPRPIQRPDRSRPARAGELPPLIADEQDAELTALALRHIEELAEEPELEPAPDDEILLAEIDFEAEEEYEEVEEAEEPVAIAEPVRAPDARQRRRRRLRFAESEEAEAEPVSAPAPPAALLETPAAPPAPTLETAEEADGEAEESSSAKRRRRRRRRGETAEAEPVAVEAEEPLGEADEAPDEDETVAPTPYFVLHHEPLERVTDDTEESAGDLLKDAMVQERISERIHAEERRTSLVEVEPTPEVLVGSLRQTMLLASDFERVSDDEAAEPAAEIAAAEPAAEVLAAEPATEAEPAAEVLAEPQAEPEIALPAAVAEEPAPEPPPAAPAVAAALPAGLRITAEYEAFAAPEPETQAAPEAAVAAPAMEAEAPVAEIPVAETEIPAPAAEPLPDPPPELAVTAALEGVPQFESIEFEAEAPIFEAPVISIVQTGVEEPEPPAMTWPETERRVSELLGTATDHFADTPQEEFQTYELENDVEVLRLDPMPEPPLPDAVAKIRQRPRRSEFATRRGGRGRRRNIQPRRAVTDATADAEEQYEEIDDFDEQEQTPPPVVVRPTAAAAPRPPVAAPRPAAAAPRPAPAPRPNGRYQRPVITDLLREGQEIIVQIAKEPIGQKGARITSHVALPGRYIVYMPTVEHIGVSRKIGTDEERQRLKRTLHQLRAETGATGGFIVRTAAHGCTNEELGDDMNYLVRTWNDIRRRSERAKAPAIAHRDLDLVQRILRDQLSGEFNAIRVDNEFEYERIVDFVSRFAPKMVTRVKLYTKDTPILDHYGVQAEIDKAVKPRVWLRSGGYIVINQTEALVAIDVNTGKFVGKSNRLEDTIVRTNLEAAKEIVRQIRLRDLGGIIVLDFIDMEERRNRQKVMQALEQELRNDKSPSKMLQFNDFGLVAITRKRVKQSLERTLCTPCSNCGGGGMVKSPQTVTYEILAEARRIAKEVDQNAEVILRVHPEVAKALRSTERDVLAEIETYVGGVITLKSDPTIHQEQFDIALV